MRGEERCSQITKYRVGLVFKEVVACMSEKVFVRRKLRWKEGRKGVGCSRKE